jgi:protein O-GlcNAcase/histone acetyltransferase
LITSAKEAGIVFYYAISPGLDIVYSSAKEVSCLKRKLEQVSQFGCNAFAILFDDIEPEISQTDKEVFQSFGQAQVSVSNEVYQALNQPRFIFCPTEYCSARAVPNVRNSEYLNTIGAKLLPEIDIMWTGSKVISKIITVESILELSEVLRRKPVIWDNLHANDYDQKRVFLGPYSGRSTDLVSHLRGVLTNPNCEYEANFIPIHTIAQWSKCKSDAKNSTSLTADIRLETESESGESEDIPSNLLGPTAYHPRRALKIAIHEWLPEFNKTKAAYGKVVAPLASVVANLSQPTPAMVEHAAAVAEEGHGDTIDSALPMENTFVPITKELVNSLVDPPVILNPILEPMDCHPSSIPPSPRVHDNPPDAQMSSQATSTSSSPENTSPARNESRTSLEEMQTDVLNSSDTNDNKLTIEDISLLVDLFYLPFEHGTQGEWLLNEFQWLKTNNHLVSKEKSVNENNDEVVEWNRRAKKFDEMQQSVSRLYHRLSFIRNRCLHHEFYPYISDINGVVSLLNSFVKKMGKTFDRCV